MTDRHADCPSKKVLITDDMFLGGRLRILQPAKGARAGIDAVLLAAAIPATPYSGERLLEAGAGAGVVTLALAKRVPGVHVTAIEIEPDLAALARQNVLRNDLQERVEIITGDVTAPSSRLEALGIRRESYDHVFTNPPFYTTGNTRMPETAMKRKAHVGPAGTLDAWLRFLTTCVAPGGSISLIHRADALPELLTHVARRFGGITVYPLFPREGTPAGRVILRATKGSRALFRLLPGAVLHRKDGSYTGRIEAVLRDCAGLDF